MSNASNEDLGVASVHRSIYDVPGRRDGRKGIGRRDDRRRHSRARDRTRRLHRDDARHHR